MGYCFVTTEKIKSFNKLEGKYKHNFRENEVLNANKDLAEFNEELVPLNHKNYKEAWDERYNEATKYTQSRKPRSDAVLAYEVLQTFSRDDKEKIDIEKWKKENVEWLYKTFGAKNVLSSIFHADEAGNVHIHSIVIPIDDSGKLNARYYTGGQRKMKEMQDSYAQVMGKNFGLKRGLENSVAKHKDIKKYYAALNQEINTELPKPLEGESIDEYYERANEIHINSNLKNLGEKLELERKIDEAETEVVNIQLEYKTKKKKLKEKENKLNEFTDGLRTKMYDYGYTVNELEKDLKTFNALKRGLKNYPDKKVREKTAESINQIVKWERDYEKKQEKEINDLLN